MTLSERDTDEKDDSSYCAIYSDTKQFDMYVPPPRSSKPTKPTPKSFSHLSKKPEKRYEVPSQKMANGREAKKNKEKQRSKDKYFSTDSSMPVRKKQQPIIQSSSDCYSSSNESRVADRCKCKKATSENSSSEDKNNELTTSFLYWSNKGNDGFEICNQQGFEKESRTPLAFCNNTGNMLYNNFDEQCRDDEVKVLYECKNAKKKVVRKNSIKECKCYLKREHSKKPKQQTSTNNFFDLVK